MKKIDENYTIIQYLNDENESPSGVLVLECGHKVDVQASLINNHFNVTYGCGCSIMQFDGKSSISFCTKHVHINDGINHICAKSSQVVWIVLGIINKTT